MPVKMGLREKIYFGHHLSTRHISKYNTANEQSLIECIEKEFPEYVVESPNQQKHADGYQKFKEKTGNGMNYYFQEVLPYMAAGIFLAFEDGRFGAGVYAEATFLKEHGRLIYEIDLVGRIKDIDLDVSRCLSIEETKSRIYGN